MKLKSRFLSLSAVLAMGVATTAWAQTTCPSTDITFEDNVASLEGDASSGYYVNMPKPSSTFCHAVRTTVEIPDGVKTFKVYDDGGANGIFNSPLCGSDGCSINLKLVAPVGYNLRVTGSIITNPDDNSASGRYGFLYVFDASVGGKVLHEYKGEDHSILDWTGNQMYLRFRSARHDGTNRDGLDLTVHVLKKNEAESNAAIDIYDHGDGSAYKVAKIKDIESGELSITTPMTVNAVEFERVFTKDVAATTVLPFSLPAGATTNARFYTLKQVEAVDGKWVATMQWIGSKALPQANTPYVVVVKNGCEPDKDSYDGKSCHLKFSNYNSVTLQTGDIVKKFNPAETWYFTGTYAYRDWAVGDEVLGLAYGYAGPTEVEMYEGQFGRMGSGSSAAPMRAFLSKANASVSLGRPLAKGEVSSIEDMPEVIDVELVDEDEKPMAIGRLNTVTGAIKIDRWFDLKGRSTNHKPTTKGAFFNKKGIAK